MSAVNQCKTHMEQAIAHFKKELSTLRTGRANPAVLDQVPLEVYGSMMRIKELANVSTPEPRQILITPFDPQTVGPIAKSLEKANLGMRPMVDGAVIRMNVPPLDEAMRKDIVKQGKEKAEKAKVALREIRRKENENVRKEKADGDITEDQMKKAEKQIQELTDKHCKEVDELFAKKEKEIMTI